MNILRLTQQQMVEKLGAQKVLMLYGTRRTGKTTTIENIVSKYPTDTLLLQGGLTALPSIQCCRERRLLNEIFLCQRKNKP